MTDSTGYGLVLPIICCQSTGGPYDDKSFIAGTRFEATNGQLRARPDKYAVYAEPNMQAQYDLLAMHHGYTLVSTPWDEHPDEWALMEFTRVTDDKPPVHFNEITKDS